MPLAGDKHRKVLILGIDGCRPDALLKARTPELDALIRDGYIAYNTQTCRHSVSGPAWSSILCGVWEEKHQVTNNSFVAHNLLRYPPLFARLKELKPEAQSVTFVDWPPLKNMLSAGTHCANLITTEDPRDFQTQDALVTAHASEFLRTQTADLVFVYWVNVDETGHVSGFSPDNPEYIQAIERVDQHVGEVLAALRARPTFEAEEWLILAVSDHGGSGTSHGQAIPEHLTCFLLVSGASTRRGVAEHEVYVVDVAPTALSYLLGSDFEPPADWGLDGRPFGLRHGSAGVFSRCDDS